MTKSKKKVSDVSNAEIEKLILLGLSNNLLSEDEIITNVAVALQVPIRRVVAVMDKLDF